VRFNS